MISALRAVWRFMSKGFVIDRQGNAWPARKPAVRATEVSSAAGHAEGDLFLGITRTGVEVILLGCAISAWTLVKATHLLSTWRPQRIAVAHLGAPDRGA